MKRYAVTLTERELDSLERWLLWCEDPATVERPMDVGCEKGEWTDPGHLYETIRAERFDDLIAEGKLRPGHTPDACRRTCHYHQ